MMNPLPSRSPSRSRRTSSEFTDAAVLEAIVPASPDLDLQTLFQEWDGELDTEENTIVPFVEQRQFLLLGISVLLVCSESY
jgi:hypothetical protein